MKYLLFLIIPSLALSWNPPINLSQMPGDDINPRVCRSWNPFSYTCVVWQRVTANAWNILTRFSTWQGTWSPIIYVTSDSNYSNENPAVAFDLMRNKVWVVWQKNIEFNNWEIFTAQGDTNGFDSSYRLTNSPEVQDANPSAFVIRDTVWVTWISSSAIETIPTKILAKYYDGVNWSPDFVIDQGLIEFFACPKINAHHNEPIIVYQKGQIGFSYIYYSEYVNNLWTTPAVVCDSPNFNSNPEVIGDDFLFGGSIVLWQNWETWDIFRTAYDTFNYHCRITEDPIADFYPVALNFGIPTLSFVPTMIAWQRGNYIYSKFEDYPELIPVDTTAPCSKPCLTAIGGSQWCIYQKNINGDWEIFGSYEAYGIEEKSSNRVKTKRLILFNKLAPFLQDKRYEVYDITGRIIENYSNIKSGLYFVKSDGEKVSVVVVK